MKPKMPSLWSSYSRILLPSRRRLASGARLPRLEMACADLRFDPRKIAAYRRICRLEPDEAVPLLYPHVLATPMHFHLLGQAGLPGGPLGLIHLRNHVQRYRHPPLHSPVALHCRLSADRRTAQGLELDIASEVWRDDLLLWQAISTYLCRGDHLAAGQAAEPAPRTDWPELTAPREPLDAWWLPRLAGWRYALLSGDFNPWHLSTLAARAGGFPRPFVHGMWGLARSLAGRRLPERLRLDGQFLAPMFLGSRVRQERCRAGTLEQWELLATVGEGRQLLLAQLDEAPRAALR